MADRVFLHIGAPKTGTSYIQLMLWQHRAQLEESGVFLPLDGRRRQFDAVADLRGGMWRTDAPGSTWEQLVQDTHKRPGTAVVSEELLCATPANGVERAVRSFGETEVHVVLGARDLVRQIPAEWQQAVRARSPVDYLTWVQRLADDEDASFWQVQDPARVFARWSSAVSADRFHLITVPPSGTTHRVLWQRFCSVLGIDGQPFDQEPTSHNQSLGVLETELLRRVNATLGDRFPLRHPYDRAVRAQFTQPVLRSREQSERIAFPEQYRDWVADRAQQLVADLDAAGCQVIGSTAELIPSEPADGAQPGEVDLEELLALAVSSIVDLIATVDEARTRQRQLSREGRAARRRARRLRIRQTATQERLREYEEQPVRMATTAVRAALQRSTRSARSSITSRLSTCSKQAHDS